MSTVTIQLPDGLAERLEAAAKAEGVTLEQFLSSAAAEKLSAWMTLDHLRARAAEANRQDFIDFLDQSPDAPAQPGDE